jgi:hypothetical protein
MSENQVKKEKKWLYFAMGLIAGFAICVLSFVIFSMIQNNTRSFTQTIEHIYKPDHEKDTVVKYVNIVRNESQSANSTEEAKQIDSLLVPDAEETYDEVDFSYADNGEPANDDVVVVDKMLAQKKVRVQCKDADFKDVASVEGSIDYFEVQQWNTPIKNRITYYCAGNVLQVKGISAEKVEIVYYDQQYYLFYGGNYYRLRNNDNFEKLGTPLVFPVKG